MRLEKDENRRNEVMGDEDLRKVVMKMRLKNYCPVVDFTMEVNPSKVVLHLRLAK